MYIKRAIHKYGREHFKIELIEEVPVETLNEREKYWIDFYDSYNTGYNLTLGGNESNHCSLHRVEDTIDIIKFKEYIKEFRPLATEVASHFGMSRCSVYNLIKKLNDPELVLNSYNPRKGKSLNDIDTNELICLYKEGWSILDLVKKYHLGKNKISAFLKNSGIKVHRGVRGYQHRI